MGLISWLHDSPKKKEMKALDSGSNTNQYTDAGFFARLFGARTQHAGIDVNYTSAMRHNDVYTCVRIKSESLGQLPVRLYRNDVAKRVEIVAGREYEIFTKRPNAYQTWQELIEQFVTSYELIGHFAAEVKRNRFGNVYEILPFRHQNNFRARMNDKGQVYYTYSTNNQQGRITTATYQSTDVLYIKSFSLDGFQGISTITQCALAIGTAIAGEQHAASLFQNGAMPMGVLQTDDSLDDEEAIQRLRTQWNELHTGSKNSGKTAILEAGLKYQPLTMSAVDSQLLEQRKFSREQIASMFRVPLSLLQAASGMTYNNVEQNNMAFFRDALMPLAQKLENNINLILPKAHFIKLDEKVFVRGDRKSMVETVKAEVDSGLCSVNEGRYELGRDPIDGGDVFAIQTNNLTFGRYDELPTFSEQQLGKQSSGGQVNDPSSNEKGTSNDT